MKPENAASDFTNIRCLGFCHTFVWVLCAVRYKEKNKDRSCMLI